MLELRKTLSARRFDAVWDMQGLLRTGLMAAATHAPQKWGRADSRECSRLFYNRTIDAPIGPGPHHAVAVLQEFPRAFGLDPEIEFPLKLNPGPKFSWQEFFDGDAAKCFVIFTDSRGVGKEWPKFNELTKLIWERIPGSRVAWCAGQNMAPTTPPPDGRFLNLTGCPLVEMIELVRAPATFIGNDSGPMHLSAAVENPVLAIFGPTSPLRFGPWPIGSPRTQSIQAPGGSLLDLGAEEVFKKLQQMPELD